MLGGVLVWVECWFGWGVGFHMLEYLIVFIANSNGLCCNLCLNCQRGWFKMYSQTHMDWSSCIYIWTAVEGRFREVDLRFVLL